MSSSPEPRPATVDFVSLLTLLFVALKLTGYIDWSWWWVLSPLWISALVAAAIVAIALWAENR